MTQAQILEAVAEYNPRYVTVTGGEPLAQKGCFSLLSQLCDRYSVSLETSGALDVADVDKRVVKILDLKTPGSGEVDKNLYSNLQHLTAQDQIKFVLCHREDYDWAKSIIRQYPVLHEAQVLFSPVHGECSPQSLAEWILQDRLQVRLQVQLHKYLWNDEPGR